MKVLVIGSRGFIGSHVHRHFSGLKNFDTWGCDVVTDYAADRYLLIDSSNADFEALFKKQQFDICLNCAGASSVPESFLNPLRDYYLNTKHVFNILEGIRKYNPTCKFLNLSSAAVYGNPKTLPISETDSVNPLSPYGWHKYQSELICREFYQIFGISTCSARIFSAFGKGLQKQLFWDWYRKISQNQTILLLGTGKESRDFIFIDDVVQAIDCISRNSSFSGEVVNVANGKEIFIQDAIELFRTVSKIDFSFSFNNVIREGDPLNWLANISKLKDLGYEQSFTFEEGLREYISWLQSPELSTRVVR